MLRRNYNTLHSEDFPVSESIVLPLLQNAYTWTRLPKILMYIHRKVHHQQLQKKIFLTQFIYFFFTKERITHTYEHKYKPAFLHCSRTTDMLL